MLELDDLWTKPVGACYGDAVPRMLDEYNGLKSSFFSPVMSIAV